MPPIGDLALHFALAVAFLLGFIPMLGLKRHHYGLLSAASTLGCWLFILLLIAFICLGMSFYLNDFSYQYVAQHSNTKLPLHYKLTAIWGSHEGSMLLWLLILSLWIAAIAWFGKHLPLPLKATTLAICGWIMFGFTLFVVLTSNPFERYLPHFPLDGNDLNPLLQDIGLIIHPPLLYMGYVGLAVPFAFVCAILLTTQFDRFTLRWIRPWTLAAWLFLTLGITVGSWWAYYELGWGGWWFWDPVENASLLPWLTTTALIHSLSATEKRHVFPIWTILLAIFSFILSILGTFLVRSGVLTSVHSFANDPARGIFILILLAIITLASLILLGLRANKLNASHQTFALVSREMGILVNNILLSVACLVVLFGTIFPLIVDVFSLGKISVGAPYFNTLITPLSLILLLFLGVAPLLRFKQDQLSRLKPKLIVMGFLSLILGFIGHYVYAQSINFIVSLTLSLSIWVLLGIMFDIHQDCRHYPNIFKGIRRISASKWGMWLGHFGFILLVIGVAFTSHYSTERDVLIKTQQSYTIDDYTFILDSLDTIKGSNFSGTQAQVTVNYRGHFLQYLYPEKRHYHVSSMSMSEVALRPSLLNELYVALGEEISPDAWAMRIYIKPFVRWIWLGGIIMALSGLVVMSDRRYRTKTRPHSIAVVSN